MSEVLLSVQGLEVAYGGIRAVKGVSLEVRQGEKVCLIGSNGAGKTTTLKAITSLLPVSAGSVQVMGLPAQGCGAWDLVQRGLVMVPEGRGVFARMSILENLQMGVHCRFDRAHHGGRPAEVELQQTMDEQLKAIKSWAHDRAMAASKA